LRATAIEASSTNGWETFWNNVETGLVGIPVPAREMWTPSNAAVFVGGPTTLALTNYGHHAASEMATPAVALRYMLNIEQRPTDGGRTNRAVLLSLWEGSFGITNAAGERRFYTEVFDQGELR
jgi:hypothetical protein